MLYPFEPIVPLQGSWPVHPNSQDAIADRELTGRITEDAHTAVIHDGTVVDRTEGILGDTDAVCPIIFLTVLVHSNFNLTQNRAFEPWILSYRAIRNGE